MAKKEKKEKSKTKHKSTKKWGYYKTEGENLKRLKEFCPKCGPGVFLGERKSENKKIFYCGSCFLTLEKNE
ncbi:MAG: 30S ribosomal protein S27ae [Candidatus Aenigmarchaeota archaeon ex4484_56]|nr:MAG: 30S ribosomal protein S27ae [Candidatus Aenigmarchaeota archaeon ex4484_56]